MLPQYESTVLSEVHTARYDVAGTRKPEMKLNIAQSYLPQRGSDSHIQQSSHKAPISSSSSSILFDLAQKDAKIPSSALLRGSLSAPQLEVAMVHTPHNETESKVPMQHKTLISASVETLRVTEQSPSTTNLQRPGQNAVRMIGSNASQDTDCNDKERYAYLNSTLQDGLLEDVPFDTPRSQHFLKQRCESGGEKMQQHEPLVFSASEKSNLADQASSKHRTDSPSQEQVTISGGQSSFEKNGIPNVLLSVPNSELHKTPSNADVTGKPESAKDSSKQQPTYPGLDSKQELSMGYASLQSKLATDPANVRSSFTISNDPSGMSVVLSQEEHTESTTTTLKQITPSPACHHVQLLTFQQKPHPPEDHTHVPREVLKVREKLKKLKEDFLKSEALHQQQWCRQRRELYFNLVRATLQKGRHVSQPGEEATESGNGNGDWDDKADNGDDHKVDGVERSPTMAVKRDGLRTFVPEPASTSESQVTPQHEAFERGGQDVEELMQRKVQQLKVKLEEREKVRRAVAEERKRRHLMKRMVRESETVDMLGCKSTMQSSSETDICRNGSGVLQYRLSGVSSEESHNLRSRSHPDFLTHDGPQCYIQPQLKSNKKLIKNALCHVCLAGEVNVTIKQRALTELDSHQAIHFLILFRDTLGFKFRALYYLVPDEDYVRQLYDVYCVIQM